MANKEALRALQQRLADRLQAVRQQAPARSWLAVEIAGHGFLLSLDQAGEIFPMSTIQPVPHSQGWFLGVANLRGQLHGIVDLATFLGLSQRQPRGLGESAARDAGRLVAFNAGLQINAALLIDRLMGLRHAGDLKPAAQAEGEDGGQGGGDARKPHFIGQSLQDEQGRTWYELDLGGLAADEAFLKIDV